MNANNLGNVVTVVGIALLVVTTISSVTDDKNNSKGLVECVSRTEQLFTLPTQMDAFSVHRAEWMNNIMGTQPIVSQLPVPQYDPTMYLE